MPTETLQTYPDRIRLILHRDLKVGQDVQLDGDTPLFGSQTDLDSLDALLLITGIEKEFKIKIPKESMGRQAFKSIRTLSEFLEAFLKNPSSAPIAPSSLALPEILSLLPHGESFRFLTTLKRLAPGDAGEATWSVTGAEPFIAGHFPGNPIVPGVLIAEAMAQLSGLLGAAPKAGEAVAPRLAARIAHLDIRYRTVVKPPVELLIQSRHVHTISGVSSFEVRAAVGQQVAAEGSLAMSFT